MPKKAAKKTEPESDFEFERRVSQEVRKLVDERTLERTDDEIEGARLASEIVGSLADDYEMLYNDLSDADGEYDDEDE